jgi:hypothetical protein
MSNTIHRTLFKLVNQSSVKDLEQEGETGHALEEWQYDHVSLMV